MIENTYDDNKFLCKMTRDLLSSPIYVQSLHKYPQSNSKIVIIIRILTKVFSFRKKREGESSYSYHRSIKRLNRSTDRPDAANLREEGHEATTCEPTSPFDRLLVRVFVRRTCLYNKDKPREGKGAGRRMDKERAMGGKVGGSMEVGNQIADERKQAGEINLPISAACC